MAYAPDGKPVSSFTVGIQVKNATGTIIAKFLRITGPRWWAPKWKRPLSDRERAEWQKHRDLFEGWTLTEPEPITSLPIRFEYAYGGAVEKGADENGNPVLAAYEYNPVGRGYIDPDWTDHTKPQAAPQIEYADEPITDPYKRYKPAGLGPIPAAWLPRRPLGGTYDQNWIDNRWPYLPDDYKYAYHNAAADDLQVKPFLTEFEIELLGLHPQKRHWTLRFKSPCPYVNADTQFGWRHSFANLDTVYFDIGAYADGDYRLHGLWRYIYDPQEVGEIQIKSLHDKDPDYAYVLRRDLLPSPSPDECEGFITRNQHSQVIDEEVFDGKYGDGLAIWKPEIMPGPLLNIPLEDVPGIGNRMKSRLLKASIVNMELLLACAPKQMRNLWRNVTGERLRYALNGYDIEAGTSERGMFGHGRVLPAESRSLSAHGIAWLLLVKAAHRLRNENYYCSLLWVSLSIDNGYWGKSYRLPIVKDDQAVLEGFVECLEACRN
ncbi:DUF2169 domain-containing protein [Bartonella sp. LJL80]